MKTPDDAWLLAWARKQNRFWSYSEDNWQPKYPLLPYFGGDEYGRRTVVLWVGPRRWVVWAFWACTDDFCSAIREQTYREEQERSLGNEQERSSDHRGGCAEGLL